jgi:hypothetical protein
MKAILPIAGLLVALTAFGCGKDEEGNAKPKPGTDTMFTSNPAPVNPARPTNVIDPNADNTRKNERDRDPGAVTPGDQGESESDLRITQEIRKRVVDDSGLSMSAKNVKIITKNGAVTLRGSVDTQNEKKEIQGHATSTKGVITVDDQIEVTGKK